MTDNFSDENLLLPDVSIIIPVYRVEKYLSHCLDSIISQTFKNWECILVDDGSPDKSGIICDEYVKKDSRFKVIHKVNEGVSKARNEGLKIAKGKWISFVDSDDYIDNITYETVLKRANENNADMVQWGIVLEREGKVLRKNFCQEGIIEGKSLIENFEPSTCHKLFLKQIIDDKCIKYPEGLTLSEDRYFSFLYYLNASRILGIKDCYYHYRIYSDSSSHNMSELNIRDEVEVIQMMENAMKNNAISDDSDFAKILINQKIEAKNHALFLLKRPNCVLWRSLFPEVNFFLKKRHDKKNVLYILLTLHLDFFVRFIIRVYVGK